MTERPRRYVESAAVVSGVAAFVLAGLLERHCRGRIANLPGDLREPAEDALRALERAGAMWASASTSGSGRLSPGPEDRVLASGPMNELSVKEAALELHLSDRRVRQLVAAGTLPARLVGRTWMIDVAAIAARKER